MPKLKQRRVGSKEKYLLNPEWQEDEGNKEDFKNCVLRLGGIDELQTYFPEDYGKEIPEDGAWIRVNSPPYCEFTVPPFSMWYAVQSYSQSPKRDYPEKLAMIITPKGNLRLYPREYCIVPDITQFFGEEHIYMRMLDGVSNLDPNQLFYIRSRGISKRDAEIWLFKGIKSQTYCWFEIHPAYAKLFGKDWPHPTRCPFAMPDYEGEIEPVPIVQIFSKKAV